MKRICVKLSKKKSQLDSRREDLSWKPHVAPERMLLLKDKQNGVVCWLHVISLASYKWHSEIQSCQTVQNAVVPHMKSIRWWTRSQRDLSKCCRNICISMFVHWLHLLFITVQDRESALMLFSSWMDKENRSCIQWELHLPIVLAGLYVNWHRLESSEEGATVEEMPPWDGAARHFPI